VRIRKPDGHRPGELLRDRLFSAVFAVTDVLLPDFDAARGSR